MTDAEALLAAICAHPDEDTPRLAYADALDALDPVRVKCPKCHGNPRFLISSEGHGKSGKTVFGNCKCDSGTVLDAASAERAEFIRVQCLAATLERDGHGGNFPRPPGWFRNYAREHAPDNEGRIRWMRKRTP